MEISAENPEVREMLNDILEHELAKKKREELSDESFKEWVYNALRTLVAKLGYTLQNFEEFWKDIGTSIKEGWLDGRDQARKEAELKRKIRERRYR